MLSTARSRSVPLDALTAAAPAASQALPTTQSHHSATPAHQAASPARQTINKIAQVVSTEPFSMARFVCPATKPASPALSLPPIAVLVPLASST
jgi:hypothetical protein